MRYSFYALVSTNESSRQEIFIAVQLRFDTSGWNIYRNLLNYHLVLVKSILSSSNNRLLFSLQWPKATFQMNRQRPNNMLHFANRFNNNIIPNYLASIRCRQEIKIGISMERVKNAQIKSRSRNDTTKIATNTNEYFYWKHRNVFFSYRSIWYIITFCTEHTPLTIYIVLCLLLFTLYLWFRLAKCVRSAQKDWNNVNRQFSAFNSIVRVTREMDVLPRQNHEMSQSNSSSTLTEWNKLWTTCNENS